MRGRHQRRLARQARHGRVRALARRAAGAVGHRHEARLQRLEPPDRRPQRLLHLLRLGREELEGDVDVAVADQPAAAFLGPCPSRSIRSSLRSLRRCAAASPAAGRPASHIDTVSLPPPSSPAGARSRRLAARSRPQSSSHCAHLRPGEARGARARTARAGTPARAARNRRSAAARPAPARAPPRARRAADRSGSAAPGA